MAVVRSAMLAAVVPSGGVIVTAFVEHGLFCRAEFKTIKIGGATFGRIEDLRRFL